MYLNWFVGFSVQFPHDWVRHLSPIWNESELRSDEHYMSRSENKTWKKKKNSGLYGIWTHDLCDNCAVLRQPCWHANKSWSLFWFQKTLELVKKWLWIYENKICELRMKSGMKAIFAIMHRRSQICRKQYPQLICSANQKGKRETLVKTSEPHKTEILKRP